MSMIRILVVDDQAIVRESLCAMLRTKPGLEIVGQAGSGEDALLQARALRPDVTLMDLVMPDADVEGVAAIRLIKAEQPQAKILVLSGFSEDAKIIESIRAGATGYILKNSLPDELVAAIRQTYRGEAPFNPTVARTLVQQIASSNEPTAADADLTDREKEIVRLIANGLSNEEIGIRLDITARTVATHVSNVLRKLGLSNRTQLALWALRNGYASLYGDGGDDNPDSD